MEREFLNSIDQIDVDRLFGLGFPDVGLTDRGIWWTGLLTKAFLL